MKKKSKNKKRNREKELHILESALKIFGEKGFEAATISAISREANISEVTLYEYFESKEDVIFSIAELYTRREVERMKQVEPYIHGSREKMRVIIQGFLEFYETYPLYASVALLTLKGNRNFLKSTAYATIREATRSILDAFEQGVEEGVFRNDVDGYLVRNMVLGFIEHLAAQWLLFGRPERITEYRDTVFDMVMRAIERKESPDCIELNLKVEGLKIPLEGKLDAAKD